MSLSYDSTAQNPSYGIRTISINFPKEKRVNCTKAQFFENLHHAGLQCVYDSAWLGTYYYDTSSLAPARVCSLKGYSDRFWRVRNYHHGKDTIPEITFTLSALHKRFFVLYPAYGLQMRRQTHVSSTCNVAEAALYRKKVADYERIVARHFAKDMGKRKRK